MYEKIAQYPQSIEAVTALPSVASNGDQVILVDSTSAPTYSWLLQYIAAKSSNRWVFIGGAPASVEIATAESVTGNTYVDLTTVGPSFTIPIAGSYELFMAVQIDTPGVAGTVGVASLKLGSADATDTECVVHSSDGTNASYAHLSSKFVRSLATSDVVKMQYRTSAGTTTFERRRLAVQPVAIGG